jgi:Arc/MetJ family transcription regulator
MTAMTKRLVDIDDELLAQARASLGAASMKDTVNRALQEVVNADLRRRHIDQLVSMKGLDLDDPEIMSGAWR